MIGRLQLIRNIGQFDSVSAGAAISLARLTLVYSENGRGKTTLAAILRSLASGDALPIAERQRLAAQHPPHVVLEHTDGPSPAVFENGAWSHTLPGLAVFDDVFIDQNVHSGLAVHPYHRQNLHELVLGAQAVTLSRRLQLLVDKIEEHNRELRARERAIPTADRGPFTVDEFCALSPRPGIDQAIQEAERALAGAREQDAILATPPFAPLTLPDFDIGAIEQVLQQNLDSLDALTLERVQSHLSTLGPEGEAWVADGMRRAPQDDSGAVEGTCPFCAQDLQGSPLIQHYRAYFSDAYADLKRTVSDALAAIARAHGRDVPAAFERAVRVAVERQQLWSRFCDVAAVTLDTAAIARDWTAARDAVAAQLTAKQAAPMEPMGVSEQARELIATYQDHRGSVAAISQRLQDANLAIALAKERASTASSDTLATDLSRLKAVKARFAPEVVALCDDYLRERAAKEATESERDQVRAQLEQHRKAVFPDFQTAINLYLAKFNAGFRLDSVRYSNTRGGPTCTYNVLINNTPVPVGAADSRPGEPSFRSTLSSGDRSTLALAFFFAALDQDAGLASKVVVIDDPISSLDEHRVLTTVQQIRQLSERVAQVIVLSHSKSLLCQLWEGMDADRRAALELARDAAGSTLRAWDVGRDSTTEHDRRHARLRDYFANGTGDRRDAARDIRHHLEAFLRVALPEQFRPGTLLGPFLNLCEQRGGTTDAILGPAAVQELRELVEYANRFHHDTNPAWQTVGINDHELRGFVDRTLTFCRPW